MTTSQLNGVIQYLGRPRLPSDEASLGDGTLLDCFIEHRDEAAFAALVRRHGPMVLGVCRRILGHCHDAEDAFQATFLVLVRKAASVSPRDMVGNWLYGVAYQTALKARERASRRRMRERPMIELPEPEATAHDLWDDLRPLLDQELSRLPDKYRVPIVLCDLEGKTGKEAARQLGWPEGTLTGRLSRARALLAQRLTRRGLQLSGGTLALLLASTASGSVPSPLIEATVEAARLFAAGAGNLLPANVITLTEGVLKAMLLTKLKLSAVVLLLVALVGVGSGAIPSRTPAVAPAVGDPAAVRVAQRDGGRGGPMHPQVRAVVKSVDTGANTITVTIATRDRETPPADKTFTLSKNAEVGVGSGGRGSGLLKEGKLGDLTAGVWVTLILSADEKTVEAVLAENPTVRGLLKEFDTGKNTVTITRSVGGRGRGEEATEEVKTYALAPRAEIGIDDGRGRRFSIREGKLDDLSAGAIVILTLTIDQKQVQSLIAEGPTISGLAKAVNADKSSVVLAIPQRGGDAEEMTKAVAQNAVILLDDGKGRRFSLKEGKLADVPAGAAISVKLSPDQTQIMTLRAEGATTGGRVKAVDPKNNLITIEIQSGRRENPEEKTLPLAKDVRVVIDGNEAKLTDIKNGEDLVQLRLSLDQKEVQSIHIGRTGR
jgi:RNA polymerase sigma factor (sigma-70 family)